MHHLFVVLVILVGVVTISTASENNGTYGESVDGSELIKLGRKLHKPMLTIVGMAMRNNRHPCGEWTPWSPCDATRRGYFGSQTRSRSCLNPGEMDQKTMTTESDNKLCEGLCPVSYNLTGNGFCLKLNTTKVSNDVAVEQCKQEGGYLIHIDSQTKLNDVKSQLGGFSTNIHIDGRRKDSTSPWEYQYGSESAFLQWHSGYQTNKADYLCLDYSISSHTQFDYTCSYLNPFVCEILKV